MELRFAVVSGLLGVAGCSTATSTGAAAAVISDAWTTLRQADVNFPTSANHALAASVASYTKDAVLMPTAEPMIGDPGTVRKEWEHVAVTPRFETLPTLTAVDVARSADFGQTRGIHTDRMQAKVVRSSSSQERG